MGGSSSSSQQPKVTFDECDAYSSWTLPSVEQAFRRFQAVKKRRPVISGARRDSAVKAAASTLKNSIKHHGGGGAAAGHAPSVDTTKHRRGSFGTHRQWIAQKTTT